MQVLARRAPPLVAHAALPLEFGVQEFANKSAASAASLGYVKFQAVIKSAASAASLSSEIGGSGSEKRLCTLPRSKP